MYSQAKNSKYLIPFFVFSIISLTSENKNKKQKIQLQDLKIYLQALTSPAMTPEISLMSMHASVLVDYVGPPSAKVCRTISNFP